MISVRPAMVEAARRMLPWMRLVAWMGMIGVVAMLAGAGDQIWRASERGLVDRDAAMGYLLGGAWILNASLMGIGTGRLFGVCGSAVQFVGTKSPTALAVLFREHRIFWQVAGILSLVAAGVNGVVFGLGFRV